MTGNLRPRGPDGLTPSVSTRSRVPNPTDFGRRPCRWTNSVTFNFRRPSDGSSRSSTELQGFNFDRRIERRFRVGVLSQFLSSVVGVGPGTYGTAKGRVVETNRHGAQTIREGDNSIEMGSRLQDDPRRHRRGWQEGTHQTSGVKRPLGFVALENSVDRTERSLKDLVLNRKELSYQLGELPPFVERVQRPSRSLFKFKTYDIPQFLTTDYPIVPGLTDKGPFVTVSSTWPPYVFGRRGRARR